MMIARQEPEDNDYYVPRDECLAADEKPGKRQAKREPTDYELSYEKEEE